MGWKCRLPPRAADEIRVEKLNGVEVSFTGIFNTLILRHQDIAGEIANVTRELADAGINIANIESVQARVRGGDVADGR